MFCINNQLNIFQLLKLYLIEKTSFVATNYYTMMACTVLTIVTVAFRGLMLCLCGCPFPCLLELHPAYFLSHKQCNRFHSHSAPFLLSLNVCINIPGELPSPRMLTSSSPSQTTGRVILHSEKIRGIFYH